MTRPSPAERVPPSYRDTTSVRHIIVTSGADRARSATRDQESPRKLVRYSVRGSSPRLGALAGDRIRCLGETYHRYLAGRGVVRAGELAHALFPPSTRGFLRAGAAAEDAIQTMEDAVRTGRLEWHAHPLAE